MRIALIHWNREEAENLARPLVDTGNEVLIHWDPEGGIPGLRKMRDSPPDAFLISLDRLPAQASSVAIWLRQQKPTRHVPIVLAGGKPEKIEAARRLLPDAVYSDWSGITASLRRAARNPPRDPVVPGTMQGYTGTPLKTKLGIKAGRTVVLLGAPAGFEKSLEPLPADVAVRKQARGSGEVVLLFTRSAADLEKRFERATRVVADGGRLWIVWPKKTSAIASDLTQNHVRQFGLARQWVDFKIAAINETWSGLAFARRK